MIAFSMWPIHVYRYGIMYLISFLIGYMTLYRGQQCGWYRRYPWIDTLIKHNLDELILMILIGVMVGGRMGHVVIYDLSYFLAHPLKIFALQEWWMSFIGGIVGTVISVGIYCYKCWVLLDKWEKIHNFKIQTYNLLSLLDAFIPLVPVGIFFGRFGNFLNQELYGTIVPYDFRWLPNWFVQFATDTQFFHVYDKIGPQLRINTNFLSMIFEGLMIASILWVCFFRYRVSKKRSAWQLSALFLGLYSVVRFVFEYLRQDSQAEFVGMLTKSQWFFTLFFVFAVVVFVRRKDRI